jgi:hypothetical protein
LTSRSPQLSEIHQSLIDRVMEDVHVSCVGRVEKYDKTIQRCQVQPLLRRGFILDGERRVERLPVVSNVPIVFPGVYHVEPGDIVLLVFCDISIDKFLSGSGNEIDPGDDRRHSLSDAFALPLASPRPRVPASQGQIVVGRDGSPVVEWDQAEIRVGGVGALPVLLSTFLDVLDVLHTAIAAGIGASGTPAGAAAAQGAVEAAIEQFKISAQLTLSTLAKAR